MTLSQQCYTSLFSSLHSKRELLIDVREAGSSRALPALEHCFAGIPTGFVDLDSQVIEATIDDFKPSSSLLENAVESLLRSRRIHTIRVRTSMELDLKPNTFFRVSRQSHTFFMLDLPKSYSDFLDQIGPRTRRNFRYYRRKAVEAEVRYQSIPQGDFDRIYRQLRNNVPYRKSNPRVGNGGKMFCAGLFRGSECLAMAIRRQSGSKALLLSQFNHQGFPKESLATVLRSFLIEELIANGVTSLFLPDGCSGLDQYCTQQSASEYLLQKPGWMTRSFSKTLVHVGSAVKTA